MLLKKRYAIFLAMLAQLSVRVACACIPVLPDPEADARRAGAIFYGSVVAERTIAGPGPMLEVVLTIEASAVLKGFAPGRTETTSGCGAYYPQRKERVIVIRLGRQYLIRQAGGEYERRLLAALRLVR